MIPYRVWLTDEREEDARSVTAECVRDAAIGVAESDYQEGMTFPQVYQVKNMLTDEVKTADVHMRMEPMFRVIAIETVPMPPAVHALWGGNALCEDGRLRCVPAEWPDDQKWLGLPDLRADAKMIEQITCALCKKKAPLIISGLEEIGARR